MRELIGVADRETGLGAARLAGEVGRSAFQFRLFADALREGSYVEATIDHAETTELGPQPETSGGARADRTGGRVRIEQLSPSRSRWPGVTRPRRSPEATPWC